MTFLLAVDSGSQSTKVSVVDETGAVHATGRAPLRAYDLGPDGEAVHPDDDLWDGLLAACAAALADFAGRPEEIAVVGLCGIRFCRALLDAEGRLTEPVLSWMDARVSRPLPEPDPRVATVTSAGGYLTVRLTGERRDTSAAYAGMWPLDPATRRWSTDEADLLRTGMPRTLLPDLVDPGEVLGDLTSQAARATGLPAGIPVVATANDKAVEALGAGLLEPGGLLLSLGTYVAAMTVAGGERPLADGDDRGWLNAAAVPGRHLVESGGIRRGMWTVGWLRDLLVSGADGPQDPVRVQGRLDEGAREVPPGCDGLLTIPDWLAPGHAPYRRGAILGLTATHGPHHLYRSVLEGLALTMRGHAEAMEDALGRRAGEVVVTGGGSRSPLMRQIVADVFGRPARGLSVADAAGTGAAVCAAVGAGVHDSFEAAVAAMVRPGDVCAPQPASRAAYQRVYEVYSALPEHTDPLFRRMATLGD